MRSALTMLLLLLLAEVPQPGPAIPYFTNVRQVHIVQPERQNYFIVDEEIWNRARADLGDLRLYDGQSLVQYALSEQRAGIASDEVEARILNLGLVAGHTEFDLDMQGLPEYDRVRLRLDAHDFVVTAWVSGGAAPGKASEVELPPSTLYDFTKEQLGSNSQLKLLPSSFRYLHVKLSTGIRPQEIKGATIYDLHEQQASWTKLGSCSPPQQRQRTTVIACDVPLRVPLNRISFEVEPTQVNFRRTVSIEDSKSRQIASGEISRVRLNRAGTLVTSEQLFVTIPENPGRFIVKIDNGENPPLSVTACDPLTLERRVYFDPQERTSLKLYYGDEKLDSPAYDYARFFHLDASPARAQLSPAEHNPQYTGRPDERPWTEQHKIVLWAAMLLAVLGLAALALRGLKSH